MQPDARYKSAPDRDQFTRRPAPETLYFHAHVRSRDYNFYAQAAPEPYVFHIAVAHTYQNVGRVPPPPRPRGKNSVQYVLVLVDLFRNTYNDDTDEPETRKNNNYEMNASRLNELKVSYICIGKQHAIFLNISLESTSILSTQ